MGRISMDTLGNWTPILSNFYQPITHKSDQHWISPYSIDTISSRQVMRIEEILVDPKPNLQTCIANSKVNY